MENATKALLISAGVIFAVVIFSAMFYIYQMVSGYYQSKESNLTTEQLAQVNDEFSVYQRDLTGFELVSLINKCIDFNQNKVYGNWNTEEGNLEKTPDGYEPMSVKITFKNDKPTNGALFTKGYTATYDGKNSGKRQKLEEEISKMRVLETKINPGDLTKLAAHTNELESAKENSNEEYKKAIQQYTGKSYDVSIEDIKKYEDYIEFKRATFKCNRMESTPYGQINYFEFSQE